MDNSDVACSLFGLVSSTPVSRHPRNIHRFAVQRWRVSYAFRAQMHVADYGEFILISRATCLPPLSLTRNFREHFLSSTYNKHHRLLLHNLKIDDILTLFVRRYFLFFFSEIFLATTFYATILREEFDSRKYVTSCCVWISGS